MLDGAKGLRKGVKEGIYTKIPYALIRGCGSNTVDNGY